MSETHTPTPARQMQIASVSQCRCSLFPPRRPQAGQPPPPGRPRGQVFYEKMQNTKERNIFCASVAHVGPHGDYVSSASHVTRASGA